MGVNLGFSYDGFLQTGVRWTGDVTGSVIWQYDNNSPGTCSPTDHLGSPVMVVNIEDATDVLFEARYDAWGNRTVLVGDEDAVPFGQGHCGLKSPIWAPPTRQSCGQDGFRRRRRSPRPTSPSSASHALELRVERTSLQLQPDSAGLTAESAAPPPWVAKVPPSATTEAPPVP